MPKKVGQTPSWGLMLVAYCNITASQQHGVRLNEFAHMKRFMVEFNALF